MQKVYTENLCTAVIEDIVWDRIHMYFTVKVDYPDNPMPDVPLRFYGVNGKGLARIRFRQEELGDGRWRLHTNVTNNGEKRCIPEGNYWFVVCQGLRPLAVCETGPDLVGRLESMSRNFFYSGRQKVYAVYFYLPDSADSLPLVMRAMPAAKTKVGFSNKGVELFKRHKWRTFKKLLNDNRRPFLRDVYKHYYKKYKDDPRRENTILFMTEQSPSLGSNQVPVIERMKARGLEGEWTILTSARPASSQGQSQRTWIALMKKLAQSKIVVVDDHAPVLDWLKLKNTKMIQLWHAGAGFKSAGYARWGHEYCPAPYSAHRQYTYGIAGSRAIRHFFSEVWGLNDEQVLPTGMPRIDEYLNPEYREAKTKELREMFPLANGKKVILYAPTYRGRNRKTAYYPYDLIDFKGLYDVCGEEYVVFFKMHPWVAEPVPVPEEMKDRIIDVGTYPNINDLFYITDLLITDYSSNIFEYSLMRKPMLFFAYDKYQYSYSRGFHRPYEESAPGKVVYTFADLLEAIRNRDFQEEKVQEYVDHHFDYIDTNACDRVIDWLILDQMPEDLQAEIDGQKQENADMRRQHFIIYDEEKGNLEEKIRAMANAELGRYLKEQEKLARLQEEGLLDTDEAGSDTDADDGSGTDSLTSADSEDEEEALASAESEDEGE